MIEYLMIQLSSMPDLNWVWAILFIVGFGLGFGGLILNMFFEKVGQVQHGLHLCYIGFAVIGICSLVVVPHGWEVQDLRDEIKSEHISLVSQMTCDDIRLEIVSVMERENQKSIKPYDYQRANLAWEEGYYYAKCELPLRDEILKLQNPTLEPENRTALNEERNRLDCLKDNRGKPKPKCFPDTPQFILEMAR